MQVRKHEFTFEVQHATYDGIEFWPRVENDTWESQSFICLRKHLNNDNAFVDIGAWIGPLTLYASRLCNYVYAIEPDKVALNHLQKNLAANCDNVTLDKRAIALHDNGVNLHSTRALGHSLSNIHGHGVVRDRVNSVTMQHFFEEHGIDNIGLLKMDIEGGEFDILPTCLEFLESYNIPIMLGVHSQHLNETDREKKYNTLSTAIHTTYKNVYDMRKLGQTGKYLPIGNIGHKNGLEDLLITNEDLH